MFMFDIKDYGWWYWLASTISLWLAMTVYPEALMWALSIGVIQLIHYRLKEGSLIRFSVQIRLGYLTYLLLALPDNLQWLLWLPTVGTLARVLFGYCLMARLLALLPINRQVPLSWKYVMDAFLTPPVRGNVLHGLPTLKAV